MRVGFATVVLAVFVAYARAADVPQPSSAAPTKAAGGFYDPQTVETVRGEVVALGEFIPAPSGVGGVYRGPQVQLKTATETIGVRLGPPSYLQAHGVRLALHQRLEVTGSRVHRPRRELIIARTVKTPKGKLVTLLTETGMPLWIIEAGGAGTQH